MATPLQDKLTPEEEAHHQHLLEVFTLSELAQAVIYRERRIAECERILRIAANPTPISREANRYFWNRADDRAKSDKYIETGIWPE